MLRRRPAYTLAELTCALLLSGVLAGFAVPAGRRTLDQLAVRAARDAIVARLAFTRAAALVHGGAGLEIDARQCVVRVISAAGDTLGGTLQLSPRRRLEIQLSGGADVAVLRYDALGIGRLANRTITVRRRGVEAGITVSAYGRWRVW